MAPHSSTLAWKIPWTEEPGRLQSVGSLRVGHDWETSLSLFTFMHWRRKLQPTPVFLPGESQKQGSLVGCRLGVAQSQTGLKWLGSSSFKIVKSFFYIIPWYHIYLYYSNTQKCLSCQVWFYFYKIKTKKTMSLDKCVESQLKWPPYYDKTVGVKETHSSYKWFYPLDVLNFQILLKVC